MAGGKNTQILLAARPQGEPKDGDYRFIETAIPEPGAGEMLLRTIYLALDPIIRLRMNANSYWPAFELGKPLGARVAASVVASNNPEFRAGDVVVCQGIWAEYMISTGKGLDGRTLSKLDPARGSITAPLSILGTTGLTAYCGLLDIGQPKANETVMVSGASGAVGSAAGQIAKLKGCRVVGSAGGEEKCAYVVKEFGFDAAVDYKRPDFALELRKACPQGIDIFFDNVGGAVFDAVVPLLNRHARVAVCGSVSEYNVTEPTNVPDKIPALLLAILGKRLTLKGFVIGDHLSRMPDFQRDASIWLREGKLKYREAIVEGIENAPRAFLSMLRAESFGKVLIRVSPDPTGRG